MHRYLLHNDDIRESGTELASFGQIGLLSGWGVFSTIRVARGVLFAFERHFARMQRDAELMRVPLPGGMEWMRSRLLKLVEANGTPDATPDATLRVSVVRNMGGAWEGPGITRPSDLVAFTTGLADWGPGVKLYLVPNGRHAASPFAGTKILSWAQNLCWYEEAHERGFDEVILLNERGEASECTSANIFVAMGRQVWTPPLSSGCLPGITRALVLEEIRVPGLTVSERPLTVQDLESADEVFITSTTRDLLPVLSIKNLTVRNNGSARSALQTAFTKLIDEYACAKLTS